MRCTRWIATAVLAIGLCGCGGGGGSGATLPQTSKATMSLLSPAFADGAAIPRRYTCDGTGVSPPLRWTGVPRAARELALVVDDTDAGFRHWTVLGLAPSTIALRAGAVPAGAIQTKNDFGHAGYGGPCPPKGSDPHHYVFAVYALDAPLELTAGASAGDVSQAITDHAVARGELIGTYRRGG